jgi:hypothetical protein
MTTTITVRVLPKWRVYHQGKVYAGGELVELPLIQACDPFWHRIRPR